MGAGAKARRSATLGSSGRAAAADAQPDTTRDRSAWSAGRAAAADAQPEPPGGGTLYVVATPIGNLGDITERAVGVLRRVPLVAAEDTRLTRRLWARHGITTRLVSYHARNALAREPELLAHLASGADLALVTDAGTPLVSDPGGSLVAAWADAGGAVVAVPGPSAVLAALVSSGIRAPRWCFEGFLPRSGRTRRERIERIARDDRATLLFEAPGRVAGTLGDLARACGPERRAALSRELTKLHEETWRGRLGDLAGRAGSNPIRGEVTIVVEGRGADDAASAGISGGGPQAAAQLPTARSEVAPLDLARARARVAALVISGLSRSFAARQVAAETGLPRRELFRPSGREG